jgi:hypothetical protein
VPGARIIVGPPLAGLHGEVFWESKKAQEKGGKKESKSRLSATILTKEHGRVLEESDDLLRAIISMESNGLKAFAAPQWPAGSRAGFVEHGHALAWQLWHQPNQCLAGLAVGRQRGQLAATVTRVALRCKGQKGEPSAADRGAKRLWAIAQLAP